ncbi:hypothetical protein ACI2KR_21465 [Pseudomonas luteola]
MRKPGVPATPPQMVGAIDMKTLLINKALEIDVGNDQVAYAALGPLSIEAGASYEDLVGKQVAVDVGGTYTAFPVEIQGEEQPYDNTLNLYSVSGVEYSITAMDFSGKNILLGTYHSLRDVEAAHRAFYATVNAAYATAQSAPQQGPSQDELATSFYDVLNKSLATRDFSADWKRMLSETLAETAIKNPEQQAHYETDYSPSL